MDEKQYFDQRLDDQINWLDGKSKWNQNWFKRLRLVEIIAAALVPFLSGMLSQTPPSPACLPWLIGALGVLIAIATAASSLFNFQENWISYRTTAEKLKQEKFFYLTQVAPYDSDSRLQILVQRVETLLAGENATWSKNSQRANNPTPAPQDNPPQD